jgi:hypothetical protein
VLGPPIPHRFELFTGKRNGLPFNFGKARPAQGHLESPGLFLFAHFVFHTRPPCGLKPGTPDCIVFQDPQFRRASPGFRNKKNDAASPRCIEGQHSSIILVTELSTKNHLAAVKPI